jgi:isopentenyl phosphate kinase
LKCKSAVVKLGGSLITVKDRVCTVDWDSLTFAVEQLVDYVRSGGRLVVVHGGGSFGHPAVKEVLAEHGELDIRGVPYVQEAMLSLAMKVYKVFRAYEVDVVLHTTHTLCDCQSCSYDPVLRDFSLGLVPIVYGDAVPCNGKFVVVSGDKLASEIASELRVDCLVYAVDVPGILVKNEVVRKIRASDALKFLEESGDVTGGMRGKVLEASRALGRVKKVIIVGGLDDGIIKALRGEEVGTEIV